MKNKYLDWSLDDLNDEWQEIDMEIARLKIVRNRIEEAITALENQDEDPYCPACNGTGEGQYDGSSCYSCKGSGVERREED